jgi:nucleoside-diphosphate-sugar epimerase
MKILVIGCGWLGTSLAERLLDKGHIVSGTTRNEEKLSFLDSIGIKAIHLDKDISPRLKNELKESDIIVINFPPGKSENYASEVGKIIQHSSANTKVIFTSSTGVYPEGNNVVNERSEVIAEHPVFCAEEIVRELKGEKATVLRLAGLICGERHPVKFLSGRKDVAKGNGPVNLVHRNDVIQSILAVLNESLWGKTYNIVHPEHPSRNEYYCEMASKLGLEWPQFRLDDGSSKKVEGDLITKESVFAYQHSIYEI